jgi:hypothetical protein
LSNGKIPSDWEETKRQIKKPDPLRDGKTWLRHGEDTQAGQIDLMLLEASYTLGEMAKKINSLFGQKSLSQRIQRIETHFDHLQKGENFPHTVSPHGLKLKKDASGKWQFDV